MPGGDALLALEAGAAVDVEGLRLAADHGVRAESLSAYRSLARARGFDLDQVLRATYRGELHEVVKRPEVRAKVGSERAR